MTAERPYRWRRVLARTLLVVAIASAAGTAFGQDPAELLRRGEVDRAIEVLTGADGRRDLAQDRLLVAAWLQRGEHQRVIDLVTPKLEEDRGALRAIGHGLGLALARSGRFELAEEVWRKVVQDAGPDDLMARIDLADLLEAGGRAEEAEQLASSLITAYNQRLELSSAELTAVARACQSLGRTDPQLFKDALKAYDEAIARDPENAEPRIRLAELFLEKYDSQQARESLAPVLTGGAPVLTGGAPVGTASPSAPALLAMARIQHFDGSPEALALTEKSLEANPSLVEARVFLAQLRLELEEHAVAVREAETALAGNPRSLEALSVLAAARYLQGDLEGFGAIRGQVLGQSPGYAGLYVRLAESCVQNRLYRQARDFAAQAVAVDPRSWSGWGELGMNQLRLGEIEEGRASLERAFAGDPYNVWNKNTLDLLDTFGDYRVSQAGRFELFIHQREAELLGPYIGALAEEAYQALAVRYRHRPPTPIRIEVYPSHEDFSVRTVGLAGLGALGVSFGTVLAIDSPSAREVGHFNWGSTLWHELTHTFTLGVTEHRIPRWLTEGLSVLEERRAREGWGDDVRPEFLQALRDGRLLGLREINNGFVRPSFPIQIALSYYQASLVCELIETEFGWPKMLELLDGYRAGENTEALFARVLGEDLDAFDRRFFAHLEHRFAGALPSFHAQAHDVHESDEAAPRPARPDPAELERLAAERPDDWRAQLGWGSVLFQRKEYDRAMVPLERAKTLFPEFVGGGNPYRMLASAKRSAGDLAGAADELQHLVAHNELAWDEHRELAELLGELDRKSERAGVLERAIYIYPLDPQLHHELALLYGELGPAERRIRELRAVVALDPPSRAEALYDLAAALAEAGERGAARREVLRSLELAPGYDPAQRLLLDLVRDGAQ